MARMIHHREGGGEWPGPASATGGGPLRVQWPLGVPNKRPQARNVAMWMDRRLASMNLDDDRVEDEVRVLSGGGTEVGGQATETCWAWDFIR